MAVTDVTYNSVDEISRFGTNLDADGPYVVVSANTTGSGTAIWIFKRVNGVLTEVVTKWTPPDAEYELQSVYNVACWYDSDADVLHFIVGWYREWVRPGPLVDAGKVRCCTYHGSGDPVVRATFNGDDAGVRFGTVVQIDKRTGRFAYASAQYLTANYAKILKRENDYDWSVDLYIAQTDFGEFGDFASKPSFWTRDNGTVYLLLGDDQRTAQPPSGLISKGNVICCYMVSDEDMGGSPPANPRPGSCYFVNNWGVGFTNGDCVEYRGVDGWVVLDNGVGGKPKYNLYHVVSTKVTAGGSFAGKEGYFFYVNVTQTFDFYAPVDKWYVRVRAPTDSIYEDVYLYYSAKFGEWQMCVPSATSSGGGIHVLRRNGDADWTQAQLIEGCIYTAGNFGQFVAVSKVLPTKTSLITAAWNSAYRIVVVYRLTDDPDDIFVPEELIPIVPTTGTPGTDCSFAVGYRLIVVGTDRYDANAGGIFVKTAYPDGTFPPERADYILQQTGHADSDDMCWRMNARLVYQEGGYIRIVAGVPDDPGTEYGSIVEFNGDVDFPSLPISYPQWPPLVPPTIPINLDATAGLEQNSIVWDAVADAETYNLYWSLSPGVTTSDNKIEGLTDPSYVHTGLTADIEYFYVATAVNSGGESGVSSEDSAIPYAFPSPTPDVYTVSSPITEVVKEEEDYTVKVHPITKKVFEGWKWDKTIWPEDKEEE